ncbi:hypothetical protein [Nonomuraea typhae]|uniref:hypothetical protein n=1 Tax=Nonomuraea typhae TaxID=2603600 RepID=UPI0012F8CA8D|nr:hypothetical protein [Nonomuraea typhae]
MRVAAVLVAVVMVAGCTSGTAGGVRPGAVAPADRLMPPVSGVPLVAGGLRLLVTGPGAFLLDVDSGRRTAIHGLPEGSEYRGFVAGRRIVIGAFTPGVAGPERLHVLDGTRARPLAEGQWAFAARDGLGVWVIRQAGGERCEVRELGFTGRPRRPGFPLRCDAAPFADSALGLLVNRADGRMEVLDRRTGAPTGRWRAVPGWQVLGATPRAALTRSVGRPARERLSLLDPATFRSAGVPVPPTEGRPVVGTPDPGGRRMAVRFVDPAFPGPRQYLDVWVLDLRTRTWSRVPSMPAPAAIKTVAMGWTPDGLLVVTGDFIMTDQVHPAESDYATLVLAWRPGETRVSLKRLPIGRRHLAELVP